MMVRLDYAVLLVFASLQLQVGFCGIEYGSESTDQPKQTDKKRTTIKQPFALVDFVLPIQSPIDVLTHLIKEENLPELKVFEPELPEVKAKFYNSGSTVYVYPVIEREDHKEKPYMEGGPLLSRFIFEQMHFHWGAGDVWGSEHKIDGVAFAAEIHMVHFNSKYTDFEDARVHDDGLAVLTLFAQIDENNNVLLEKLTEKLPDIHNPKSATYLNWNDAMQWVLSALDVNTEYYAYPGSLTTKPYSENVAFILLPKPITISHHQLSLFRKLHDTKERLLIENKRDLQPLNDRPIRKGPVAPQPKRNDSEK